MLDVISVIALTLFAALIAAFSQYIIKRSITEFDLDIKSMKRLITTKGFVLGILLYFTALVVYLNALKSGELSLVYPTFASTFVFVFLLSKHALKEKMSTKRVLGIIILIIGIIIVAITH